MRPIDGDSLKRHVKAECNPYGKPTIGFEDGCKVLDMIDNEPTIESLQLEAEWIDKEVRGTMTNVCSNCGCDSVYPNKYCGNCGRAMRNGY